MSKLPRIYADFNGYYSFPEYDVVELDTKGTLTDLHFQQIALTDGLELMAWDQSDEHEDLEAIGTCHFHHDPRPHWCLHIPSRSLSYVSGRHQMSSPFFCFRCRHLIAGPDQPLCVDACPSCGLLVHYPWQDPKGSSA